MTAKPTILFLVALAAIASSASAATKPNATKVEPIFETDTWPRSKPIECKDRRARYVAELTLPLYRETFRASAVAVRAIMESSPLIQKLSPTQEDLLMTGHAVNVHSQTKSQKPHLRITLYAVSEEDAKAMAEALLDALTSKAQEHRAQYTRELDEIKAKLQQAQRKLAEKETRLQELGREYQQQKDNLHPHLRDEEVVQLAKELIFQMDKEGNMLNIELAGIRAKLTIIDEHLRKPALDDHVRQRLEGMKIDQLIELGGLDARRAAVEQIRTVEQTLYSLYSERHALQVNTESHRTDVEQLKNVVEARTSELKRTSGRLVPPQDSERKVTLYAI